MPIINSVIKGSGGGSSGYSELPSYSVSGGILGKRTSVLTGNEFNGVTQIAQKGLQYTFYNCSGLTGNLSFPDLTYIYDSGLLSAFYGCSGLTGSLSFPYLTFIDEKGLSYAFYGCSGISTVTFSSLEETEIDAIKYAFRGCTSLTTVRFPSLNYMYQSFQYAFHGCTSLTDIYFNALDVDSIEDHNEFAGMLLNTGTNVTHTLHFPNNMISVVQSLSNYPLFGGTSGYVTIAFDLPATSGPGTGGGSNN